MDEALGPTNSTYTSTENAVTKDGILHYKAGTSYLGKEQWKTCFVVLRWAPGLWVGTGISQGLSEKVLGPVCCPGTVWGMERTHRVTWEAKATSCGCPAAGMQPHGAARLEGRAVGPKAEGFCVVARAELTPVTTSLVFPNGSNGILYQYPDRTDVTPLLSINMG